VIKTGVVRKINDRNFASPQQNSALEQRKELTGFVRKPPKKMLEFEIYFEFPAAFFTQENPPRSGFSRPVNYQLPAYLFPLPE
jgi:hypothetical protein